MSICRTLESLGLAWDGEIAWQGTAPRALRSGPAAAAASRLHLSLPLLAAGNRRLRLARHRGRRLSGNLPRSRAGRHRGRRGPLSRGGRARSCSRIAFAAGSRRISRATSAISSSSAAMACTPTSSRWWSTTPTTGITDVVRGADLLWSTPRQVGAAAARWALPTPRYLHVPVRRPMPPARSSRSRRSRLRLAMAIAAHCARRFASSASPGSSPARRPKSLMRHGKHGT